MYGAILGDRISLAHKRESSGVFYLVDRKINFTDYTVSIIALADALTGDDSDDCDEKIRQSLIRWGKEFLNENYSPHFRKWLKEPVPIDDIDNGAAVRASILPYIYGDSEIIEEFAISSTSITHADFSNLMDSLLAAIAVYYGMRSSGRNGAKINFESVTVSEIQPPNGKKNIVVEAMDSFLESTDIESAIQNAIARGGDISARAVIAGSIAEGFYGVPNGLKEWCNRMLPESMLEVLDRVDKVARRKFPHVENTQEYMTGTLIEDAVRQYRQNKNETTWNNVMNQIYYGMREGGHLLVPLIVPEEKRGAQIFMPECTTYVTYQIEDGKNFVMASTDDSPEFSEKYSDIYCGTIENIFSEIAKDDAEESGIVLNPDKEDLMFPLDKDLLNKILNYTPPENKLLYFDGTVEELNATAVVASDFEGFRHTSFGDPDEIKAAHFMKKTSERDNKYVLYTPLAFYDGDDENVILNCYRSCLNLAKKYHLMSVAFPAHLIGDMQLMTSATQLWFAENEDCGMTIIFATGSGKAVDDKKRNFFAVHFRDETKSADYRNLVARAKTRHLKYREDIKPTEADKQRTRAFAATFSDREKFWDALKSKGIKWNENDNPNINDMWARNALSKVIACGFDPNDAVALFAPTVDGVNICEEINLYTYWQGFGYAKKTPKIKYLLVAQDWGNFFDAPDEFKSIVTKMNEGEKIFPAVGNDTTSVNLVELFKVLGRDVTKPCADVFFTNFCLGYRLGQNSGGMTKELMMRDADLFCNLCEILEPENILCLGRLTSECVYESLTGEPFGEIYGDAKSYNDFLDNHPQIVVHYGDGGTSNFYPLAHCGFYGTRNRSHDKQRQDWQRIRELQSSE